MAIYFIRLIPGYLLYGYLLFLRLGIYRIITFRCGFYVIPKRVSSESLLVSIVSARNG